MVDIKTLMFDKSLSQRAMADIMNTTQSEVSQIANGNRKILRKHIDGLIEYFGEDTINQYTLPDAPFAGIQHEATVTIIDPETAAEMRKDVEAEIMEEESIPILPEELATKPEIDIREYIEESGSELERINPSQMLRHAHLAEKILRTSMLPTFQPEDVVFVRFIADKMKIVDGDTYYIDSRTYPTLIRQVKFEGEEHLRLIAQNKQFGDILMHRDDVLNIGAIVGLLRMNFSNQYNELEALRKQRDTQLRQVFDMMMEQSKQQGQLIDFITKK